MKERKYEPTPYWRMISRKGPQQWRAGKKIPAAEQRFDFLDAKQQAALLLSCLSCLFI